MKKLGNAMHLTGMRNSTQSSLAFQVAKKYVAVECSRGLRTPIPSQLALKVAKDRWNVEFQKTSTKQAGAKLALQLVKVKTPKSEMMPIRNKHSRLVEIKRSSTIYT